MNTAEFLKALTEASGVSGYEHEVRGLVTAEFGLLCDEVSTDAMGSVWGIKRGSPGEHRIMLAGHMDEIGLIVKAIDKDVLRFTQVGGFDVRVLPGQPVWVHGRQTMPGVIGMRPPHVMSAEERDKVLPMEDLFVDVGLTADQIGGQVRVGDLITLRRGYVELRNGFVASKAMDDRAGVAALHHCLQVLQGMRQRWDVYAVATVQEEVGLRGAMTSSYGVEPQAAIAVDVTFARTPDVPEMRTIEADKGPGIARGPNLHPVMYERLVETAKKHEIPYQCEAIPGRSGTDAWAIQVCREGVPTGLLGLPLRYMHTPVETLCLRDVERCGRLMAHFIADLDDAILDRFRPALPEE
ncbi:MAG: M42 family metallopeptidase [Anaerolineae bacterium]|nr:M42 family metallopeptidase [Anaerolineae bacterium]